MFAKYEKNIFRKRNYINFSKKINYIYAEICYFAMDLAFFKLEFEAVINAKTNISQY